MAADRLTSRPHGAIIALEAQAAESLTFNELLALAGQRLADRQAAVESWAHREEDADRLRDAGRDLSVAHTALEDALHRYNSACERLAGTWKRTDPDAS